MVTPWSNIYMNGVRYVAERQAYYFKIILNIDIGIKLQ